MPRTNNIQFRKGTYNQWDAQSSTVLGSGEPGFVTDFNKLKIGDGTTQWSDLSAINDALTTLVYNGTASTIPKMSVVYINGAQGDMPSIRLSIASGEMTSSKTYGITTNAISAGGTGMVVVDGALKNLNTSPAFDGVTPGTTLWLSPTVSGGITTTKPSGPNHMVSVGNLIRVHNQQGIINVKIQNGFELEELHNVAVSGVSDGQFLYYNSSSGLWQPNANIYSSGNSIGIGTSFPYGTFDVYGNIFVGTNVNGKLIIGDDSYGGELGILTNVDEALAIKYNDGSFRYGESLPGASDGIVVSSGKNVGIGTASPTSKLHVNGDVLFEGGSLTFDGSTLNVAGLPNNDPVAWGDPGIITAAITNGPTTISLHSYTSNSNFEDGYWGGGVISLLTADSATSTPTLTITPFGFVFGDSTVQNTAWTGSITSSQVTNFNSSVSGLVSGIYAPLISPSFTNTPTVPTAASGTNTTQIASTAFVRTEISNLVASAPTALDTLNELATALGNDASFSTTVTNNLAGKANLSGATFTGSVSGPSGNFTSLKVNSVDVSASGHTHSSSNITNFNSSVSGLLPTGTANYLSKFGTGGSGLSNSLIFDNGTNIGIGTTSPLAKLHISSTGNNDTILEYTNSTAGFNSGVVPLKLSLTAGNGVAVGAGVGLDLVTRSNSVEYIGGRIQTNRTDTSNNHALTFWAGGGTTALTEYMRIGSNGNVGIGTASPSARLEVAASGTTNLDIAHFSNSNGVEKAKISLSSAGDGTFSIIDASNNTDIFLTSNSSTASYINAGNVGIGFTAPRAILDVSGVIRSTSYITSDTEFRLNNSAFSRVATMDGAGAFAGGYNVYLSGSTPKHNSAGSLSSYYYSSDGSIRFYTNSSQSADTNASERLRITSSGDVGIGTTTPGYKLQVAGSFGATTKSFRIDHPSKSGWNLEYGSLESPYHGVRLTGRGTVIKGVGVVSLPAYLKDLIHDDTTLNIQITNIKHGKTIYLEEIDLKNDQFIVKADRAKTLGELEFFWTLTGVRKDVDHLVVEKEN